MQEFNNNILTFEFKDIFKVKTISSIILILLCLYIENKIISKVNNINKIHKISVFLPIFNKEKYLKRSIGSIQKQTLKDIEIIAVNDGSTDNSLYILKNLSRKE